MREKNKIIMLGDIHGEYSKVRHDLKRLDITDCYVIQCGDVGLGFYRPNYYKHELTLLNQELEKRNIHMYFIRGNHDFPEYFLQTNNPFDLNNITLLADYSELDLLGQSFLFVGGAISIDRAFRVEGKSYWKDEEFILKLEDEFPYKDRQYDVVVTHTRPGVCGAFKGFDNIKYWTDQDFDLKNDLIEEAQKLDYLYEKTKPRLWAYGHFHQSSTTVYENTTFKCVDIHEYVENVIDKPETQE
jgi:predicted phosphodiesterase